MALLAETTEHWTLEVWSRDESLEGARRRLAATLQRRGLPVPPQRMRVRAGDPAGTEARWRDLHERALFFFENQPYEFEFVFRFPGAVTVQHRQRSVAEAFRVRGNRITAALNFGNDVGWFHLELRFETPEGPRVEAIAFEVHPTKLDMERDLAQIHRAVDAAYPLWRFAFAQRTEQGVRRVARPHEHLPLLWIEQFRSLREALDGAVRRVCEAPHQRTLESSRQTRVEALRGRLSARHEARVTELLGEGNGARRMRQTTRACSVDTPENRFVRGVLEHCDREVARFAQRLTAASARSGTADLSEGVSRELGAWQRTLRTRLAHGLFRSVRAAPALHGESQVLHQRAGYAGVYRAWQQLRMYFEVFGRDASISTKTVAELYQVWCLLALADMLRALGFEDERRERPHLDARGVEVTIPAGGRGAVFCFRRGRTRVRLAHEPVFERYRGPLRDGQTLSWLQAQRPDFVLEVSFASGERLLWVFDAKYRVELDGAADRAPEDAINQMHRYRDAIVRCESDAPETPRLSRPVVGAFVLFPGWYSAATQFDPRQNPYREAIDAVGIGAFPLLPGQENPWLREFLRAQLGGDAAAAAPDLQLAQQAPRIATSGLRVRRDADLVFVAHLGPLAGRDPAYVDGFRTGTARWFHTYDEALERGQITRAKMADITRCAVAVADDTEAWSVRHVYDVRGVQRLDRSRLTPAQTGTQTPSRSGACWLFELGACVALPQPVRYEPPPRYAARITPYGSLQVATTIDDIDERY